MRVLIHISFYIRSLMATSIKRQSLGSTGMMSNRLTSTPKKECISSEIFSTDVPSTSYCIITWCWRFHMWTIHVEPSASDDGLLRCEGKVGRRDRVEDAFLFWSACEAVGHHSRKAQRSAFDGCCHQKSGMEGDMDKYAHLSYFYAFYIFILYMFD